MIPQPGTTPEEVAAKRLRGFIREKTSGGCRMLSQGDDCQCLLCDVDRLAARLASPAAPPEARDRADKHCLWRTHRPDGTRRSWCRNHEGAAHRKWLAEQTQAGTAPPPPL